jgi:hypothetical protein
MRHFAQESSGNTQPLKRPPSPARPELAKDEWMSHCHTLRAVLLNHLTKIASFVSLPE